MLPPSKSLTDSQLPMSLKQGGTCPVSEGDMVRVWSNSRGLWLDDGLVLKVADVDLFDDAGTTVPAGSVHVIYEGGRHTKWIPRAQVPAVLKPHSSAGGPLLPSDDSEDDQGKSPQKDGSRSKDGCMGVIYKRFRSLSRPGSSKASLPQAHGASQLAYASAEAWTAMRVGKAHDIGQRPSMEDAFVHVPRLTSKPEGDFVAVYDGHGGVECVNVVKDQLHNVLVNSLRKFDGAVEQALYEAFVQTDERIKKCQVMRTGCTACCCYFQRTAGVTTLYTANVGDTRAVLCRGGAAKRLTAASDHRPSDPGERSRVEKAGGCITRGRVWGCLAVTRALGDHNLKEAGVQSAITCTPEISKETLTFKDEFVILACDGLWDVVSEQEAVNMVRKSKKGREHTAQLATELARELVQFAMKRGTTDNVTCSVVLP
mmetsp:Transcript_29070/g.66867  ORF Transcript_29070/g.66867 Transcript_29070/m.66867 type:complete len:428 (+) Transcript_29070:31-1314(+)